MIPHHEPHRCNRRRRQREEETGTLVSPHLPVGFHTPDTLIDISTTASTLASSFMSTISVMPFSSASTLVLRLGMSQIVANDSTVSTATGAPSGAVMT